MDLISTGQLVHEAVKALDGHKPIKRRVGRVLQDVRWDPLWCLLYFCFKHDTLEKRFLILVLIGTSKYGSEDILSKTEDMNEQKIESYFISIALPTAFLQLDKSFVSNLILFVSNFIKWKSTNLFRSEIMVL